MLARTKNATGFYSNIYKTLKAIKLSSGDWTAQDEKCKLL